MSKMKHYHFNKITSTNDGAKELLDKENPVFVTADYQTNGRGRNHKNWIGDSKENIYCSIGIQHNERVTLENIVVFQAIGTIAARLAMTEAIGNNIFHLKYPNDVVVKSEEGKLKKICGVLAENGFIGSHCVYSIIGIGINVNQTIFSSELAETATSLKLLGYNLKNDYLLKLLEKYLEDLIKLNHNALFNIWKDELHIEGKEISIIGENEKWMVEKMQEDGRLLLINKENSKKRIYDDGDSIRYPI